MQLINVREEKRRLRKKFKKLRADCPPDLKAKLDSALTAQVLSLDEYLKSDALFIFVSSPIECDTKGIIADAFSRNKRVAVPKCLDNRGTMEFYYINSFDELETGMYGILEPNPETAEKAVDFSRGLCIVPGLCFDLEGYRVGFGKGYYDRFLDAFNGVTAGICYSRYTQKQLPRGIYDRHTDILVTEKFINRFV